LIGLIFEAAHAFREALALRRHVSTQLVQKRSLKVVRNSTACGTCVHGYTLARNPRKHCVDGGYALELNLLFWVGDEKCEVMQAGGFDMAMTPGCCRSPRPSLSAGMASARCIDPDYRRRMELDAILAAVGRLHTEAVGVPIQSAPASKTEGEMSQARPAAYRRTLSS
jgi:hypothetical protein